jgi:D-alanine transaminase
MMNEKQSCLVFINGKYLPMEEARVSVEDRGFQFADGVYDVIRCYRGKPFALYLHLQRLQNSAAGLSIPMPYTLEEFKDICLQLLKQNPVDQGTIYIQITRGFSMRTHSFPSESLQPTTVVYVRSINPIGPRLRKEGVYVITLPDDRWNHCNLKTICLLPNVLAKEEATRRGANEALLYGPGGIVYEGSTSNVCFIKDGVLCTHPLTNKVLPGISRHVLLELAREGGIPVEEVPRTVTEFEEADEVFLTSTTREVLPVTRIDDSVISGGKAGPMTRQLYEAFLDRAAKEVGIDSCY